MCLTPVVISQSIQGTLEGEMGTLLIEWLTERYTERWEL